VYYLLIIARLGALHDAKAKLTPRIQCWPIRNINKNGTIALSIIQ
jgi:hypothetical protein